MAQLPFAAEEDVFPFRRYYLPIWIALSICLFLIPSWYLRPALYTGFNFSWFWSGGSSATARFIYTAITSGYLLIVLAGVKEMRYSFPSEPSHWLALLAATWFCIATITRLVTRLTNQMGVSSTIIFTLVAVIFQIVWAYLLIVKTRPQMESQAWKIAASAAGALLVIGAISTLAFRLLFFEDSGILPANVHPGEIMLLLSYAIFIPKLVASVVLILAVITGIVGDLKGPWPRHWSHWFALSLSLLAVLCPTVSYWLWRVGNAAFMLLA
jgi:hypothetical protein